MPEINEALDTTELNNDGISRDGGADGIRDRDNISLPPPTWSPPSWIGDVITRKMAPFSALSLQQSAGKCFRGLLGEREELEEELRRDMLAPLGRVNKEVDEEDGLTEFGGSDLMMASPTTPHICIIKLN